MPKINISFPPEGESALSAKQYTDFFSAQASSLSSNKQICTSLTLTSGGADALAGLRTYLQQSLEFFTKELIIHLEPSAFEGEALQETLKLLADKGLISLKFISKDLNEEAAGRLLETVKQHHITVDIELWAGVEAVQQELDAYVSVFQREKRIAEFGEKRPEKIQLKNKVKRTRKKNTVATIDTDAELEVQVEIAVEAGVEHAIEEQEEDRCNSELIDRAEFVRRAKAKEFKIDSSAYTNLQGKEHRTWDRWMGNIHQALVGPKNRKKVGVAFGLVHNPREEGFEYFYSIRVLGETIDLSTIRIDFTAYSKNGVGASSTFIPFFLSDEEKLAFIEQFIPGGIKGFEQFYQSTDYRSVEIFSDQQWEALFPKSVPHMSKQYPLYTDFDEAEKWKGEWITDADFLDENQEALWELISRCPIQFKKPQASLRLYENPKISQMTAEACEQLLAHQAQLQYGLDFAHLPAGFELNEVLLGDKMVFVLDYNEHKAHLIPKDPYVLRLEKTESLLPLADDLFKKWLSSAPKDSLLLQQYKLLEANYDRNQLVEFKQYLPVMLQLPHDLLTEFGIEAKGLIQAAMHHKKHLTTVKGILKSHLLIQLLKEDIDKGDIIDALGAWHKRLNLSASDLNGLLSIYNSYGTEGLSALFSIWEKASIQVDEVTKDDFFLQRLKQHYFPHCDSFIPLLDPSFEEALNILKYLPQEERTFWNALFEQHMSAVGYDTLLPLVKAFQHFREQVKEKNLSFYTPCHFIGIKNMQVALSRMSSILENTPSEDLPLVWKEITSLDLGPSGAIRLLEDQTASLTQGQVLLPEMGLSVPYYSKKHDWSLNKKVFPSHGYQAIKITHQDPNKREYKGISFYDDSNDNDYYPNHLQQIIADSKNMEELKRNYIRYVFAQRHHLSLGFYQKAAECIDETSDNFEVRAGLYALVAAASSGFKASRNFQDEKEALGLVSKLCWSLKEIHFLPGIPYPNDGIRKSVLLRLLYKLEPMAPLPNLISLMLIVQKAYTFEWTDSSKAKAQFEELSRVLGIINDVSKNHDYAFYEGMKFIVLNEMNQEDYSKYADLAVLLSPRFSSLIRLMSTFQLNKEIPDKIISFNFSSQFKPLLQYSLSLLSHMQSNISPVTGKALTQEDLLAFIQELGQRHASKKAGTTDNALVLEYVQEQFGSYFAPDFFKDLVNPGLSEALKQEISAGFNTSVERTLVNDLLLSFKEPEAKLAYGETLFLLKRISARLKFPERERIDFLKLLGRLNSSQDNRLSELNRLLNAIGERAKADDFIFMMQQAAKEQVSNLIPKITLYHEHVLPILYAKRSEHLSHADLQPLGVQLALNTKEEPEAFAASLSEVLGELARVIDYCPSEKKSILGLVSQFIDKAKDKEGFALFSFVKFLCEAGKYDISPDLIRSLSDHYQSQPLELYALLDKIKDPQQWSQRSILLMITSLLNNRRSCSLEVLEEFLKLCSSSSSVLFHLSQEFFKSPPYPTLEQIITWHKEHKDPLNYKDQMKASYQEYSRSPCAREPKNGFKLEDAKKLAASFQGIAFEEKELVALNQAIEAVTTEATDSLKLELKALSTLSEEERVEQYPRLLAIVGELLYRSKGSEENSYELNSVQYLAVLGFLKSKGHMTSEMATGEGKSRTMMISIACQYALGNTVDFVTSDMQLAGRDYLEYQAFFKLLGAKTRLISASSNPDDYNKLGGIHFSDASNLSLFRNKARSQGKSASVINEDKGKRALLLDEADRTYFDISETRFNYSDTPKASPIKDMEWIYPFLVRFFNQSDAAQKQHCSHLYYEDIEGCTEAFIEFIKAQPDYKESMLEQIKEVPQAQLESWQEAAVMALNLRLGTDYALEPNVLVETRYGPKLASEARLIYGHRLSRNSKFAFGVHQCLHAHLNIELKNPDSATSIKCKQLASLEDKEKEVSVQPFFIHPEKQIVYSSTSKSFLDEYEAGTLWGITGTSGAIQEQEEASALYATKGKVMEFIKVPRKNSLQRKDDSMRLTRDLKQRAKALLEYIDEARTAGRPVLLICEDDTQAALLRDKLQDLLKQRPEHERIPQAQMQFIDSTSSSKQEEAVIQQAGKPGVVTIATSRLGRGTDIHLSPESKQAGGLRVLGSYLPTERDQWQIFGRSGRYGDLGDTRLVVDKEQLVQQLGTKDLDADFFLSNEFYIQSKQAHKDKDKQIERLIRHSLSDFRMKITDNFFEYYDHLPKGDPQNKTAIDFWAQCTKKIDQIWNQSKPELDELMKKPEVKTSQIKAHLARFKELAQKEWDILHTQLGGDSGKLPKKLEDLELDLRTEHLLKQILPKRRYTRQDRTQVYKAYDKALDGRAVIYDDIFTELKATWSGERKLFANTRAWLEGHGILFADTRAFLAGKRPLFATLRTWMYQDKVAKKEQQIQCRTILEALEKNDTQALRDFVHHQDAVEFIEPRANDLLLSFKIQLIEAVLNYAHVQLENRGKVTQSDSILIRELLELIKNASADEPVMIASINEKLQPLKHGFFGHSLKKEVSKVINEHIEEESLIKKTRT